MSDAEKIDSSAAAAAPRTHWQVCAGDPTFVSVPGIAKPIACGSQARAQLIVGAVNHFEALMTALHPFAEMSTTSETPGVARDDDHDALIYAARVAYNRAKIHRVWKV